MGGNEGGNSGISEFISLVLEPVAREQVGNMEINATNGLLADIVDLNAELSREREVPEVSPQEEEVGKAQELSSHEEEVSSHEEGYCPPPSQEDGNMPITGGPCHHNGGGAPHQQINTRASGQSNLHVDVKDASQLDEPGSQTSQNLQDGKEQVTRQTNLYMQDGKDDEVQYETDEEEFEDENLPRMS